MLVVIVVNYFRQDVELSPIQRSNPCWVTSYNIIIGCHYDTITKRHGICRLCSPLRMSELYTRCCEGVMLSRYAILMLQQRTRSNAYPKNAR